MKLTQEEINFFKKISNTEVGKQLLAYLKRVQDHVYDSREWKEGFGKDSAKHAADTIQTLLIDKIHTKGDNNTVINQFE